MPSAFLMVGLPAAGKTERARELTRRRGALRFTPDEWLIPLVGRSGEGQIRDVLEGRFLWLGLEALTLGVDVVFDFGFWSRDERTAVRHLVQAVGARAEIVFLPVERDVQAARVMERFRTAPGTTFPMSLADLDSFAEAFEPPSEEELAEPLPTDAESVSRWRRWAAQRWPSFPVDADA